MRASVSTRIFMGFTLVILAFCLVSVYSVYKIHRIHGNLRLIKAGYLRLILTLTEADGDLRSYEVVLDERDPVLLTRSVRLAAVLHPFPAIIRRHLGEARRVAEDAARGLGVEPSEAESLAGLGERLRALVDRMDDFEALSGELALAVEERHFDRAAEIQRRLKIESRNLRREVKRMTVSLQHDIDHSILRARRIETRSFWAVVILSVIAVTLSLLITFLAQRSLTPILRLTEEAKRVSEGAELGPVDIRSSDEVGILAREFNRMVETLRLRDDQLRRTERLATIGRMSSQVAHEVRNPLQSIGLNAELLEEEVLELGDTEARQEALGLLRAIQTEVERLAEVTEDYLRLARMPSPERQPEQLNDIVDALLSFSAEELARAGIEVVTELEPGLPLLQLDENQLRQALLNLVRNSREAMDGGGRLELRTARTSDGVELRLRDTGSGIPDQARAHIFEPFFSTKRGGTGLGLAMTQSIVEAHGGSIDCDSVVGEGTSFVIRLPAGKGEAA